LIIAKQLGGLLPETLIMINRISYEALGLYNKIIVYGAGQVGMCFLKSLDRQMFNKSKIIIWDRKYRERGSICGISIAKPDFSISADGDDTVVIIALSFRKNQPLIHEIEEKFTNAGYNHICLSENVSSFVNNIVVDNYKDTAYQDCIYQSDMDFSGFTPLVKPIAFYLPQFHEIPENNDWWGNGFTEWTNTRKALPRFKGHYQPREPHEDIGYYDLSDANIIRKQAELAKRHGIYGWSVYYYWFSGRRLLEKPLDLLLENKDIDINFCLTWCNETWSKRWVGDEREELIECEYRDDDPDKFIDDIFKYVDDRRYIRINGKPVIMVYKPNDIPDIKNVVFRWRRRAHKNGLGDLFIISIINPHTLADLKLSDCFDGETEFTPANSYYVSNAINLVDRMNKVISNYVYTFDDCFSNYVKAIETSNHSAYLSCMCGFDNSPRYTDRFRIYDLGFSVKQFYNTVKYITDKTIASNRNHIFVFAWNEWAESAYLEPDKRFGYMMINTFSKAIHGLSFDFDLFD